MSITRTGRLAFVAGVLLLALGWAVPAGAAEAARLTVREADATEFPNVRMVVQVAGEDIRTGDLTVRENGRVISDFDAVPLGDSRTEIGVVLAIDASHSMAENDAIDKAKSAAKAFVQRLGANERVAIVSFGVQPRVVTKFTNDRARLTAAIDDIVLENGTVLWDGVRTAANLFDGQRGLQANVVVLSDGEDRDSIADASLAKGAALEHHVAVSAIALNTAGGPLASLTKATGGELYQADDPDALTDVYARVQQSLQNQLEISYVSRATSDALELGVSAKDLTGERTVRVGSAASGVATDPVVVSSGEGVPFLQGPAGKWIAIALALVGASVLAYAIALLVSREEDALTAMLEPYAEGVEPEDEGRQGVGLVETAFLKRAVQLTSQVAERQGLLPKLETALERADLPLRAGEALFVYLVLALVLSALAAVMTRSFIMGLIALFVVAMLPPAVLNFLAGRRRKKFMSQLPDTLQLLAGSLRAGYSLMQGVEAVSQEVEDPMGRELRRVVAESRLGRPLEESLDDAAERMGSNDFAWAVMAIRIQREVGGNLSELLLTVADTMVARERLRRDVAALTAEGKISAIVLGILPVGLGGVMYAVNPDYINVLVEERIGNFMLGGAILLAVAGFAWMRKTIQIEV